MAQTLETRAIVVNASSTGTPNIRIASTSTSNNSSDLGLPIYITYGKVGTSKPIVINGSQGLINPFSGNGTLKGIDVTEIGTSLLTLKPNGVVDLKGQILMTANDGSRIRADFYAIGDTDTAQTVISNGVAFLHRISTTDKLATFDNMVLASETQADKYGNAVITGWELK
jgi:hypothetical protein